ncbi:MAG: CBS domain-containing protein [Desulfovibrio sp.]|nr:CBS domain-containing protein [Desulfovibrio sp.]
MNTVTPVQVMRILLGETAQHEGRPLYECLVEEARRRGMAGATITRGFMGFGANSLLHTAKILRLSEDLPVIVEIVDTPARIADFLPVADAMVSEGTIVLEEARAIFHLPMRIRDVMSADVATVSPSTPLPDVVDLLLRKGIKAVPVVEGKRVVGIVTGGDLLARAGMPLRLDVQDQLPGGVRKEHLRSLDDQKRTAADVMTAPVATLNIKTSVPDALSLMARRNLKRLPVGDDSGNLTGIVSRADVLRAIAKAAAMTGTLASLPPGIKATARDVMYADVPTARPDTPVRDVLDALLATPLRRVVVVDEGRVIRGIVLDRDLVALYAKKSRPGVLRALVAALSGREAGWEDLTGTAAEVMRAEVFTLAPDAPLSEVIRLLVEHKAKRLVVADGRGRLLGMVDRDAVLRGLTEDRASQ